MADVGRNLDPNPRLSLSPYLPISQPSDQRPRIAECFDKLMVDVGRNLDANPRLSLSPSLPISQPSDQRPRIAECFDKLMADPSDQRPGIAECFDKLMADVGRNLDPNPRLSLSPYLPAIGSAAAHSRVL
ncbi:unnamed protein product [Closterium sp. NIES-64]|nr:unnamed protein product [Closterium sp. NIES-65]CAI5957511.1 unnamed protein product [Closterium sp. NIES-65]CAI5993167.1 unnamed protein product [Closterium sp. NIES-64]